MNFGDFGVKFFEYLTEETKMKNSDTNQKHNMIIRWIICLLVIFPTCTTVSHADITLNSAIGLPPIGVGWTSSNGGSIGADGVTLENQEFYAQQTLSIDQVGGEPRNIAFEARLSAVAATTEEEAGARIWFTPLVEGSAQRRLIEVRMLLGGSVAERSFAIIGDGSTTPAKTAANQPAEIRVNWEVTSSSPIYNVRLMLVGNDVVLEVEEFDAVERDRSPTKQKVVAPMTIVNFPGSFGETNPEIGFGNRGSNATDSRWEEIHLTITDDSTTVLPYWPLLPPSPTLTLATADPPPHEVNSRVDLPLGAYLVNDAVTLVLDTLSGELSSAPILDPSAPPAQHIETFTGLTSDQTFTGWVEIADVSGRISIGPSVNVGPPQGPIEAILEFFDESVGNGILEGAGDDPGRMLNAMKNMLVAAGALMEGDYFGWACFTLSRAEKHSDGIPSHSDLVIGEAVPELNGMIQQLRENLGCR